MEPLRTRLISLLRWSERYTKTDMVYLATSGFWMNGHVLVVSAASFFLAIAFANLLRPEVYGTYQYLLSFSAILGALTLTGMNYAITQAVARGHEGSLQEAVRLQLVWGALPAIAGLLIGGYYYLAGNQTLGLGILATGILVPLANAFNTFNAFLHGRKQFRESFFANALLTFLYFIAMLAAILFLKSALALLLVNLAVSAVVLFGLYVWTVRTYRPNTSTDPETLSYGKHLSVMYAFSLIVRQLDGILVFQVLGPVQLAIYSIASAIPERVAGLFRFLFTASLAKYSVQTRESVRATIIGKMVRVAIVAAVVASAYALIAPILFATLFPTYSASLPFSQVYALVIITAAGNLSVSALLSQKLKAELYLFNTLLPLLGLVLQVALIFPFGIMGVLAARIASSALEALVSLALLFWSPVKRG